MTTDVSVIVVLYQSDIKKTFMTLNSIIRQLNVAFEIILSDDGSSIDISNEVETYLISNNFLEYKFLKHEKNVGTVKNCLDAVSVAQGEYVYVISPGDCLYDESTLKKMVDLVKEKKCDFCFGLAQYYSNRNGIFELYKNPYLVCPSVYQSDGYNCTIAKVNFFNENMPVGASYLRKKRIFIEYLKKIVDKVIYIEDKSTSYMYILDNQKLFFFPHRVVWYEVGDGISTSSKGNEKLVKDSEEINKLIVSMYSEDFVVRYKIMNDHLIAWKERILIEANYFYIRLMRKIKRMHSQMKSDKEQKERFDFMTTN